MTDLFIVIEGNAIDGLSFTGPFADADAATAYAEQEIEVEWHVKELDPPTGATDPWEDDPDYPAADWQAEVAANDTRRGYRDWVAAQREDENPEE